jgi:RNA-binding protein YhbY
MTILCLHVVSKEIKKLKGTPVAEIEECLETREIVAVNIAGDCVESTNITSEVVTQNEVAAMKKIC